MPGRDKTSANLSRRRLLQASAGERRVQWHYGGRNPVYVTFGGTVDQPLRLLNWGRLRETSLVE